MHNAIDTTLNGANSDNFIHCKWKYVEQLAEMRNVREEVWASQQLKSWKNKQEKKNVYTWRG